MCSLVYLLCSVLVLVDVVVEQLGDEVDVRQDHAPAAVARQTKAVESHALNGLLSLSFTRSSVIVVGASRVDTSLLISLNLCDQVNVLVVLVANNLSKKQLHKSVW